MVDIHPHTKKKMKPNRCAMMIAEVRFHNIAVLLKQAGLDFMMIDLEHGVFDANDLIPMFMQAQLVELPTIVRLPDNQRRDIMRLLDMGATGVLLPMTHTVADIQAVVEHALYPPMGKRGVSTMRAHTAYAPPALKAGMTSANARTEIYAQIESRSGLEHVEAILAVEGVTGVYVGPNDLAVDLGVLDQDDDQVIHDAIMQVGSAAKHHQKLAGIITQNQAYLKTALAAGFSQFVIGSELHVLKEGARNIKQTVKALER